MHKLEGVRLFTSALYSSLKGLCVMALWGLGLFIYSRSLFLEKSPIKEHNADTLPAVYRKGVVLVMDGVRADAIHKVSSDRQNKYHSNFSVLDRIPVQDIFKAVSIADLPTGTAMRILSTFSGIPTTLLSAQRSFKNQSSEVDNFISQLQRCGRSFVFYGDETWTYLFPEIKSNIGEIYHPYGLIPFSEEKRLIKAALEAQNTHDLVIIHLISPDSYGHVHGTDSAEVQKALLMINGFIGDLYDTLTDQSFIAVLSDHGVNDDGSHGGTSLKEKAASFLFIAKDINSQNVEAHNEKREQNKKSDEIPVEKKTADESVFPEHSSTSRRKTQTSNNRENTASGADSRNGKKYLDRAVYKEYSEEIKQLNISEDVNIISQNDILPTLCAFTGLAVPYNSSGSLIPQLFCEEKHKDVYKWEIARQKKALSYLLNKKEYLPAMEEKSSSLSTINESLGNEIHSLFHSSSVAGMAAGVVIVAAGILLHLVVFRVQIISLFLAISVFAMFMIAHSVYSIIHEDIISLFVCLGFSWPMWSPWMVVMLPLMTLLAGEFPLHSVDRFTFIRWIKKLPARYTYLIFEKVFFFSSIACFVRYWILPPLIRKKSQNVATAGTLLFAVSQFFSSGAVHITRSAILCLYPTLLPLLLYTPVSACMFLYVFCPIVNKSISCIKYPAQQGCFLFFLIKIMFFVTGHNHALSSINWEAAFLFSKKSIPVLSGALVASDLLLPFAYIGYALGRENVQTLHVIVFLQAVCVVLGCVINFWFLGQSLMWFIFTGRTVFECFFLIMFSLFQTALSAYPSASSKIDSTASFIKIGRMGSTLEEKSKGLKE
ncbi:GPI ethanolamine phosphate transferase 3 subunit O [Nematocida minor]|uniref:GPI ethanolamine phosphate transferase 3 subunit O n=1 Tax=Nematocida minor TaxID=1912983 RepID=UPI00221E8D83|nr:GPI ethanolamine phosphate transferase 3 subunit O [Nematocida minor]KAI5190417.1 GPI ethanolamine phosphate transferase 3 subunit O [Nematocida minor]